MIYRYLTYLVLPLVLAALLTGCTSSAEEDIELERDLSMLTATAITLDTEKDFEALQALIEEAADVTIVSIEGINHFAATDWRAVDAANFSAAGEDGRRYFVMMELEDSLRVWAIRDTTESHGDDNVIYNGGVDRFAPLWEIMLDDDRYSSASILSTFTELRNLGFCELVRAEMIEDGIAPQRANDTQTTNAKIEVESPGGKVYLLYMTNTLRSIRDVQTGELILRNGIVLELQD